MSSSRLVTKKRRSNEKEDDDLRRQRSTKYKNASMRSRIDELGLICKTRKKITSSPYEDKDYEFFKQLSEEGWPDADKCMWLSSGSSSPSSCNDDQRFYALSDLNMSLNQRLVFVLALLANLSPKMSGARMLPDESFIRSLDETSIVLQRSPSTQSEGDVKEDETVTSLWSETRNESAESFPGVASGNYSIFSNPSSVSRRESDPRMLESDKIGISAPLVDLEEENSNLNLDTEFDVDFLQPDFPSPSCKNSMVSDVQTSNSSIVQGTEAGNGGTGSFLSIADVSRSEALNLEDCDADEPLFWPSDLKFAWPSEAAHDFFVMSPPKKKFKAEATENTWEMREEKKQSNADLSRVEAVDLDDVKPDEPLVWPFCQKFDWSPEAVENFFTMSPSKKKCKQVVTSQNTLPSIKVEKDYITDASGADTVNLEDFKTDEPLLWPSDQKFDWSSEAVWNFFNMSPPKKKSKVVRSKNNLSSIKVDKSCSILDASEDEAVNLDDINADEPLLWPSDQKFDWNSDAAFNFFIMSPLKRRHGAAKFGNSPSTVKNDEDFIMQFSGDEPLFWPSDQEFDWDSDATKNYFIISPRKKIIEVVTSQKNKYEEMEAGRKRNRAISPGIQSSKNFKLKYLSDSKGVSRTKSVPAKLSEYHRFFCEDGVF